MNSELKSSLDDQLASGAITPEQYLASVRGLLNGAADTVQDTLQERIAQQHPRFKYRIRPWMWGVAVPVLLLIRLDQMPRTPVSYDSSQYSSGLSPSEGASPEVTIRDVVREAYEQAGPRDIFSMPSQPPNDPIANPQQHGGQSMSQEDAFALGLIISPFLQQQQAYSQQQELARQQQLMQQQMLRQQTEAERQQRALQFAQRFQSLGMPDYARPKPAKQQAPPSWIQHQPQPPSQSQRPSVVEPQSRDCNFTCSKCGLRQIFNRHHGGGTRCPNCGSMMFLKR